MNKNLLFGLLIGCFSSVALAQEDEQAYLTFMALLNKQTELVTKTKLNADYVPGSVTVLQGDELRGFGARTVFDAVGFAPGIGLQRNHMGHHVLVVRGMGTPFSGGMVKLMLDNVNYVGSAAGYAETLLNMPLDQVERVEIIRGAASVLHGDFAYAGVVNVVTKSRNYATVSYGSDQFAAVNISHRFELAGAGSSVGVQLAQWQRSATDTRTAGDLLTQADKFVFAGLGAYSQAPGIINDQQRFRQLGLDWQDEHNRAYFNLLQYQTGDYYGVAEFLPAKTRDDNQQFQDISLGFEHEGSLSAHLKYEAKMGWLQRDYDLNTLYTSADIPFMQAHPVYGKYAYRRPIENRLTEQVWSVNGQLVFDGWAQHRWLVGAEFERHTIDHAESKNMPTARENVTERLASPGDARNVLAVFVQDEWTPIEPLTITLGLRAQKTQIDYQDTTVGVGAFGEPFKDLETPFFTPKLAAVYRLSDQHIFKGQYSRSMITPPIHQVVNVGTTERPKTAQTDHYELGYIFKTARQTQRFNAFYSEYQSLPRGTIYYHYFAGNPALKVDGKAYQGVNDVTSRGLEWDSEFQLRSNITGFANVTWAQTLDQKLQKPLVGSSDYLAHLGLKYRPTFDWQLAGRVQYVGERYREPYDPRASLAAYTTTHLMASYTGFDKNLQLSIGVDNLFDTQVRHPAPISVALSETAPAPVAAYDEDYPAAGRQIWLQVRYDY